MIAEARLPCTAEGHRGSGAAADQYNRRLEKSIGQFDVTHNFKFGIVYDLPVGNGKRFLNHGLGAWVLGNWRASSIHYYASGQPISLGTSYALPIFAGRNAAYVTSYEGWRPATLGGSFDPAVDRFLVPYGTGPFPTQGTNTPMNGIGNVTQEGQSA